MEINNDPKFNAYCGLDKTAHKNKMSAAHSDNKRGDRLDLSGNKPSKNETDMEIRQDEIARVKDNIAAGRYEDPKVIGKIIDRIIDQFGL